MPSCIQIEGDPTKWWIAEEFPTSELNAGQPLTVTSLAPIEGILVLSAKSATVAVLNAPSGTPPAALSIPGEIIYVPTATGPSAGHIGYELSAGADPGTLAGQIQTLMHNGQSQTITLGGAGGTLVLNGATLSFAVTGPNTLGGATPHG